MSPKHYSMSFTTGTLFLRESVDLAKLFLELQDWERVKQQAIEENTVQARTLTTSRKVIREVVSRLRLLSEREIELIAHGPLPEQQHIAWLAACLRYDFIKEFASEVVREHFLSLKGRVVAEDFESFFHQKTLTHPQLESITPTTRQKLRQILFKMLREAGLLDVKGTILNVGLSAEFIKATSSRGGEPLKYFPSYES